MPLKVGWGEKGIQLVFADQFKLALAQYWTKYDVTGGPERENTLHITA